MPWTRSNERFIRQWLVLGDIPLGRPGQGLARASTAAKAAIRPAVKMEHQAPNGKKIAWRAVTAWSDATDLSDGTGLKRDLIAYAFATIAAQRGRARRCFALAATRASASG